MVLGAVYGFLRPLRPKRTALADGFFVLAMLSGWLYVHFKVCGADIRPVYNLAMVLGGFGWECTAGILLRPVFRQFWREIGKIRDFITLHVKKFWERTKIFLL